MIRHFLLGSLLSWAAMTSIAWAQATESIVAARVIAGRTIVTEADLRFSETVHVGALTDPLDAVGLEARVTIYPGRPIRAGDLGAPAVVERNDIVRLNYSHGPLIIETDGRALSRGAIGERVRVMNLSSRATVSGTIVGAGRVEVSR